ncbi:FUSC family protein [Micromonospora sp. NBC_00898]|uniref:FUSC family protein n=1 Tax=Micromonospora sp. NBC_00898 TaxID=2975981 RepID=UPI003866C6B8|nr:FUSC family protein [Micromonospora sp. NBC_00898]
MRLGRSVVSWLRRRDPGYRAVRRAARLTLVASVNFYGCRYGLGSTVLATYALFATVATGMFAQLSGDASQRARTLLAALPMAWVLVAIGTVLAWSTWAAAAGMLVVGFAVAFAGVGGPRLVGLANAFQLFYILACFPPYQPGTLPARLAGVTLGVVLVSLAEVALWPDPAPVAFPHRLGDAAKGVAAFLEGIADVMSGQQGADAEVARRHTRAIRAVEQVRILQLPPTRRPMSASVRDRALRDAAAAVHEMLALAESLATEPGTTETRDADAARLLRQSAVSIRSSGDIALGEAQAAGTDDHLDAAGAALERRRARAGQRAHATRLRVDAIAQAVVEQAGIFATATRVAGGFRTRQATERPATGPDQFWYARRSVLSLYWQQFRAHLTPRSVYFEGAVRLAVALAAARIIAGTFNLLHGFWVLLAILTLLRTSGADTRTTLRPALVGTLIGAVAGGLLLLSSPPPEIYLALLPITMVLAFGVGPLLGMGWSQAMLTLLLIFVFAQLTPVNWQLVGARVVDVLIGAAVGVLAGLLMWPRGASSELRRNAAAYLGAAAEAIAQTVKVLAGKEETPEAVDAARRGKILTDASFAQYHFERHDPRMSHVDWEVVLIAGNRILHGAEALLARDRPGVLASWPDSAAQLVGWAQRLRSAYADLARQLPQGQIRRPVAPPAAATDVVDRVDESIRGGETRPEVLRLVEIDVWLAGLTSHIARIQSPPMAPAEHRKKA